MNIVHGSPRRVRGLISRVGWKCGPNCGVENCDHLDPDFHWIQEYGKTSAAGFLHTASFSGCRWRVYLYTYLHLGHNCIVRVGCIVWTVTRGRERGPEATNQCLHWPWPLSKIPGLLQPRIDRANISQPGIAAASSPHSIYSASISSLSWIEVKSVSPHTQKRKGIWQYSLIP